MFYRSLFHQRQFKYLGALYIHSLIRNFAISLFQIFSTIYVYQILTSYNFSPQHALSLTALFLALIFLTQAISIAPSIWLISKRGLKFSVFWGNVFLILFFALLLLSKYDPIFFVLTAILGGIQTGLYWTAYHIYFSRLTDDKKQGEEIALGSSLSAIAVIGGPAFGGLIISFNGFPAVFTVMTILVLIASFPLRYLPKDDDRISVNIKETMKALSPRTQEKSYLAIAGVGIADSTAVYFWPLFVFPILSGFIGVGFMGSLMAFVGSIATLIIGMLIDRYGARKIIRILSTTDSLAWILRLITNTPTRVFFISGAQAFTTGGEFITMDSMVYERARHHNLIAIILQREVGLIIGRLIFLSLMGALFWFGVPITAAFIISAAATLLARLYPEPGER